MDAIPDGTKIQGLLKPDIIWLKERSKTANELYKNTINLWLWKDSEQHIFELNEVLKDNAERRVVSNPMGMNKTKSMGAGISLPSGLYMALNKVDPELFNDKKKLNLFKKSFPQFKTY